MEHFLTLLLSQYGDTIAILVCIVFLYIKVNFLTGKVEDVQKDVKDHIKFHLCQHDGKEV